MIYTHKKSGRLYEVISKEVINATNKDDGTVMVLYKSRYCDSNKTGLFVRELNEFNEKFEPYEKVNKFDNVFNTVVLIFISLLYCVMGGKVLWDYTNIALTTGHGWMDVICGGLFGLFGYWWLYTEIIVKKVITNQQREI